MLEFRSKKSKTFWWKRRNWQLWMSKINCFCIQMPVLKLSPAFWCKFKQKLRTVYSCHAQWAPYLLGKQFIVRTDHKYLVYLTNSIVPKLVRWQIILSGFKYLIKHIPETSNVVADGLTRVRWIEGICHSDSKRHMCHNSSIERIYRLGGEDLLDGEDEGLKKKTKLMKIKKKKT